MSVLDGDVKLVESCTRRCRLFFDLVLSCLVCTVLRSALLLDARFGGQFFPDTSYVTSTIFDHDQLL